MRRAIFASRCANLARLCASWTSDTLVLDDLLDEEEREETVRRFVNEVRGRLDWIETELSIPAKREEAPE